MDYSACVGLYPKPGCGTKPVLSGDRGGAMQIAVFGVLIAGMAFIGFRIARRVIARERERDKVAGIKPSLQRLCVSCVEKPWSTVCRFWTY